MGTHAYELLGRGTYSTNCLTEIHFMVRESKVFLVTGATDGCVAVWPVDWITHDGSGRVSIHETSTVQAIKWELHHAVHTSSIKALEHEEILPGYQILLSGGDDNSLSVTLVKLEDDVRVVSSVCVANAHASAITAVKILSCHTDTTTTIEIASSGNDQRVKLWSVVVDLETENTQEQVISVSLKTDRYSPVADIAAMDEMEIATKRVLVVGGVGTEMLRLS
jgi:WD40 repeat protein